MADRHKSYRCAPRRRRVIVITLGPLIAVFLGACGSIHDIQAPINQPPVAAIDPEPADGAGGVGLAPMLHWGGGTDPDGDVVIFEIYLGTAEPLPLVGTSSVASLTVPERLMPEVELHWRVVSRDIRGAATESQTWSFRTADSIIGNNPPTRPVNPDPADGSASVPLAATLSWSGGVDSDLDAVTFDVYFGTVNPPPYVTTQAGVGYDPPGDLAPEMLYFWQVIARDNQGGVTPGPIWSFSTQRRSNQLPSSPRDPEPPDGASGATRATVLQWSGGVDPDRDPVTFSIYFGTTNPPPLVAAQAGASYDPPGDLDYETTHYWQVIARDDQGGVAPGPIWSFFTESRPNQAPSAPGNPQPPDGTSGATRATVLQWTGGIDPDGDPVTFDIYFGATTPPPLAATQTGRSYDPPGNLDYETTYYWQVVAWDDRDGVAIGPIWTFSTESRPNEPPEVPENPAPANGAIAVAVDTTLSWSGGSDPDGDHVDFHVYFGTDDPPPFAAIVAGSSYDPPGDLDPLSIYFWRIVAVDGRGGETSGGTWMFTTGPSARAGIPTLAARGVRR